MARRVIPLHATANFFRDPPLPWVLNGSNLRKLLQDRRFLILSLNDSNLGQHLENKLRLPSQPLSFHSS
jgi:hypothetical protein